VRLSARAAAGEAGRERGGGEKAGMGHGSLPVWSQTLWQATVRPGRAGSAGGNGSPGGGSSGEGISPLIGWKRRLPGVEARHLGEQRLRVGVVGPGEERLGRRALDHAAEIHDHHPVGDVLDHAEVVADEQVGEPELVAQVHEEVQHLRLDRDVERGHASSQTMKVRLTASARAMPMRWRWPPENWCG
jgi:hypothetical protein